MLTSYSDIRRFDDKLDRVLAQNAKILHNQRLTLLQGMLMDDQLVQLSDDIKALNDYVVAVAGINAEKDAKIAELTAQHAADVAAGTAAADAAATLHADIATVMAQADAAKAAIPAPVVVAPPVVVEPPAADPAPVADPVPADPTA